MKHYSSLIALACIAQGLALSAHEKDCHNKPFYIRAEGGKSYAQKANLNVDVTMFDPATEGYDSKLGSAAMFGIGFGYNITNWFSAGFSVAHRSKYEYSKHQTAVTTDNIPVPLGNKTRFFDLDNTSFFFDMYLNRAGSSSYFSWNCHGLNFAPFFGASVGLAKNTLYNFHSVLDGIVTIAGTNVETRQVQTIQNEFVKHAFAWQVSLGLDITLCEDVTLGIAYRFFDGGKFSSNNYITNDVSINQGPGLTAPAATSPIATTPWTGKLKAHEVIANFTINF